MPVISTTAGTGRCANEVTGFGAGTVPLLLIAYSAATVVGNTVVGRLADRHTVGVQLAGLALNVFFLVGFALAPERQG
nr:hypothetical protein [Streptomyces halobius]